MSERKPKASRRRHSTISRLPPEQKDHVDRLLREDTLTYDEMVEELRDKWPDAPASRISRSALSRYHLAVRELSGRMREIDTAARALVGELGEDEMERGGALLAHAVTTLATNAALLAQQDTELDIDSVRKIARAARDAMATRKASTDERVKIEQVAREKLLREQEKKLDDVAAARGLGPEQVKFWREEFLGIRR